MTFNRFTTFLLFRLSGIGILMLGIAMTRLQPQWFFVVLILSLLLLISAYQLYQFVSRTNQDLIKVLSALKNNDFSLHFSESYSGYLFENLHQTFNEVAELYRQNQLEKEAHKEFLKIAVDQLGIGVIAIDEQERILIFNQFARHCLSSRAPTDWNILRLRKIPLVLKMEEMTEGSTSIFDFHHEEHHMRLTIRSHHFVILQQSIRLFTFQDIHKELDQQELNSWHQIIRILTHEIMNSLTPVISLTETAEMLLDTEQELSANLPDIKSSVHTAQSRAKGLLNFVRSYRQFLQIPQPKLAPVDLTAFINNLHQLFAPVFAEQQISFQPRIKASISNFQGDQYLLEQVFINLIQNAIDALQDTPAAVIECIVTQQQNLLIFQIKDNGPGIAAQLMDKVFVPFFTTKERGTGIGLSLSRQIIVAHGGRMRVEQAVEGGAVMVVELMI